MVTARVIVVGVALESTACTVKVNVPAARGVPVTAPVLPLIVSPAGSAPREIDHEYGAAPPLTCTVWLYGVPTTPPGSVPIVMSSGMENFETFEFVSASCAV